MRRIVTRHNNVTVPPTEAAIQAACLRALAIQRRCEDARREWATLVGAIRCAEAALARTPAPTSAVLDCTE